MARNAHRSLTRWATAPRTFSPDRSAREASQTASRFTATPTSATVSTGPPATAGGWISRRTAETVNQQASSTRVIPLACADSASTRVKP